MNVFDLREILQYVPRFRERTFVIAVDGAIAAHENFSNILLDIAVLRSLNINVVFVHGAAHQMRETGQQLGVKLSDCHGAGVTDEATLQVSINAGIRLTHEIIEGLARVDLRAAYTNAIIANPAGILGGKDYKFTGRVDRVDVKSLNLLLNEGIVPVIPPLGFDGEGNTYRVNSDSVAVEVADALGAAKIMFLMAEEIPAKLPHQIAADEVAKFLKKERENLSPGIAARLKAATLACQSDVPRVHLLNGAINEALLTEIFSHDGFGTMVFANEYHQIRPARKKDAPAIRALIRQSVRTNELIDRPRADIMSNIGNYRLLEVDGRPVACVALHVYPQENIGELACLQVSKAYENQGYGRKLIAYVEELARKKGLKKLFALSTQAANYFQQKGGFTVADIAEIPQERREKLLASRRNSLALMKTIRK